MDATTSMRPLLMLPEILVFVGGLAALLSGSFLPRSRQRVAGRIAALALAGAAVAAGVQLAGPDTEAMNGAFRVDVATGGARLVAVAGALLVVVLASEELAGAARESETYALLLFATTGALVLAGAADLLVVAVAFLLMSLPLSALVGMARTRRSAEAAMKTYLVGALFGIVLLAGVTLLFGVAGTTSYADLGGRLAAAPAGVVALGFVGVLGGLLFEAGAVPGHVWVPDAAQAATGTAAAFLTTVPKVGAAVAAYRLVLVVPDEVRPGLLVAVLAALSMTWGNLAAYPQTDPRRLLGWSTVSQAGYVLVPVAVAGRSELALPSLLVYLAGYSAANLGAFAVAASVPGLRALGDYGGLAASRPAVSGALVVALLGLLGTPPTAVFVGKLTVAAAAWDAGAAWLAVMVLATTVLSLFYYLRWFGVLYRRGEPPPDVLPRRASSGVAVLAATVSVLLGLGAGLLWSLVG